MAYSVDYVVRETASNLWRNRLMSLAAVLTIAVSLALVGSALLIKQGVSVATSQWQGGTQLLIFLEPNATKAQTSAINDQLKASSAVKSYFYVNQAASYVEFKRLEANQPDFLSSVTQKDIPPSFRVALKDPAEAAAVGGIFNAQAGVMKVQYNRAAINTMLKISSIAQVVILGLATILLLSASVLILNVIRVAIFSRRREVTVMKLVGATNMFIRIPFMLEGLIQGLAGAIVAGLAVLGVRRLFGYIIHHFKAQLLSSFVLSNHDVLFTELFVLAIGTVVGALGSLLAVRRYLDI
ncbi:cell division protein FtsX [Acidithrix ferrooxidans]|uniref:Cell division protein FtsX n=1 Tax=Acidithrix ferrooxidans TaxID=1280514 RepID=A0A0D8HCS7_9ACTN|nr:permease-like cell division protein FtsX [Acidithrix ferrooxidans]KJF15699.1 cell division protein FtsX [Acidithrix ferrooxidans]